MLDAQIVIKTDTSNYVLRAILSLYFADSNIHSIAFHFYPFSASELNYNIHNKELLTIFEAFKIWKYYLESPDLSVDIITDHKNPTYFSTTNILTR